MNDFLLYVFKSVVALMLFAAVYQAVFMKEGNFRLRRIYLLASVSLAVILPLFPFRFSFVDNNLPSVLLDEVIVYSNGIRLIRETSDFPLAQIARGVYFILSGFLILRVFVNSSLVLIKVATSNPEMSDGLKLFYLTDKNISYSFFRNIFIGETDVKEEQERIYEHEKVHALQLHSVDVLYIEFFSAIFWFNPLVWWYRKEIKNVHEYLADQGALEKGFNRKSYQITLLEHLIGSASLSITNNFNYSLIKNRIAMMNKEKSSKKNNWKVFLLIPSCIVIAVAFACTEKSKSIDTDQSLLKLVYYKVEQMPVFKGGSEALLRYVFTNVTYPAEAAKAGVAGRVLVQFVVTEKGKVDIDLENYNIDKESLVKSTETGELHVVAFMPAEGSVTENTEKYVELLKMEAIRVISSIPDFEKPGMQGGKPVAVMYTVPINFALE